MEQLDVSQESTPEESPAEDVVIENDVAPEVAPEDDSTETEALLPDAEDEEIDYEGEKYKVPKSLKDAFLRQQDYTQKTQAVAERRKAVEARAQQLAQFEQLQRQNIAEYAEAHSLENQLKAYQGINWQSLIDTDPVQAMKLDRQMRELQSRRDQVVASVTQKQQTQQLQMQQEAAKRLQEGRAVLEREIKGWSPEMAQALQAYGREIGFAPEELANVNDPRSVKLLHKAWQFDQLMKKQATPKEKPTPQEKPVTRIAASKSSVAKDPSKMSDAEFAQWRKRQIAQRR